MRCPRCRSESPPDATFCPECGAPLEIACAACGTANAPTHKFCKRCGQALTAAAPGARFASPETYTPPHLAEKILSSRSALEGERKQVTVLFADLKGSMELLADRDPEEARRLLDPVLERMMEAVHRYEGTVNQVMGDGIMALFGAPLAHEDHAVRACYAALRMQEGVSRYSEEIQRAQGVPVQIRIGLNSGEVVVRSIGSDLRMDYTAVGQTTHLAARMEQMARPGSILLTGDALRLAEGFVQVRPLGPVSVKGLEAPIEVYEITGAGPVRRRLEASAARGFTRFVGRQIEVEALRQALDKARAGHGQVVALVGEPGVGKSRLFWEFTHSHRTHGWLILESGSVSYGKATAYLPAIDLLKAYFQIESRDEPRKIREKVSGKLVTLDETLMPTLPAFLALLDLPVEDGPWEALDPPQRRQRTLEAVKRLLSRESQVQPLCLVFEDLHWIDTETQALLDSLIESLPTARILLLVNYRPEYEHHWGSKTYYTQLRIDPLPPDSAEELLRALLGDGAGLEPLKHLLIERTEGNPFFMEESVRTLVEAQVLVGERGAYRLARSLSGIQVPATVQAILAARIDRLPPKEKSLLQTAAVIGKDVPFTVLQAIADLPEEALRHGLTNLQAAEFLYEASLFPDLEYTFKHALTHEVAYGSLLHERRRALHRRIVETIEQRHPDRLGEEVERLAHHAFRAETWQKAVTYSRQAGSKAMGRSAFREAAASYEQALGALQHLPEGRETAEQAIDLRLALRRALHPLGEIGRVLDYLHEAETLARGLDDQRRLGRVSADMAEFLWWAGRSDEAVEPGQRALALASALGEVRLQIVTNVYLGQIYNALGDYGRAIDALKSSAELLKAQERPDRFSVLFSVVARTWWVWCLQEVGEFAEGSDRADEAVRLAEAADYAYGLAAAYWAVGALHLTRGEFPKSIPALERALNLSRTLHFMDHLPAAASSLGYSYALSGRVSEALPLLEEAVGQHLNWAVEPAWIGYLAEGYLRAGRVEDARDYAERALDLSRARKQRGFQAYALRLLGEVASHPDAPDLESAEDYYREALALADELRMRPLVAHCHLGLGTLYSRVGRREAARAALAEATRLFGSMGMAFWLSRTEAAIGTLGAPP